MHLDVRDLRDFYYRTELGRAAQWAIRAQVAAFWPEARGQTVAGFGFAAPLLRPFLGQARRVTALMPAPQGVMPWPEGLPNISVLTEDTAWPIADGSIDRLLMLHGLETSETPGAVLNEAARVLAPGGRLLAIVPNRAGIWARRETTPFGFGRPYTRRQIESQLDRHGFAPGRHGSALFLLPSARRFWLRSAVVLERLGQSMPARLAGGVLLVEARLMGQRPAGQRRRLARPLAVLGGLAPVGPRPA